MEFIDFIRIVQKSTLDHSIPMEPFFADFVEIHTVYLFVDEFGKFLQNFPRVLQQFGHFNYH